MNNGWKYFREGVTFCEFCRPEQSISDKNMRVLSLFAHMCKQNVELFGNPDLLNDIRFLVEYACVFLNCPAPSSSNVRFFKLVLLNFIFSVV